MKKIHDKPNNTNFKKVRCRESRQYTHCKRGSSRGTQNWKPMMVGNPTKIHMVSVRISLPGKFSDSCFHGAPLRSFGGSCPNTRSISKRFIFLRGYLARGTISPSTLARILLLSVSFSFNRFILPRFLAAFFRLFASRLSYLAILSSSMPNQIHLLPQQKLLNHLYLMPHLDQCMHLKHLF